MREIKFRGISKEDFCKGKWIYGSLQQFKGCAIFDKDIKNWISVDKNTIGQYTGLRDKNGEEIYEGDIVKFKRTDDEEFIGEISYVDRYGAFFVIHSGCSDNQLYAFDGYEVIGNIYENPELLKEEENERKTNGTNGLVL